VIVIAVRASIISGARKRLDIANRRHQVFEIVKQASEKLDKAIEIAASYEMNLAKQIDFPLMTDVMQEPVSQYVRNMRLALSAKNALPEIPSLYTAEQYLNKVTEFEISLQAAEEWAKKIKWSNFSVAEVRRLKDAKVSLSLLEDSTTSPDQRNALYRRLEKLLSGMILITDPVKLTLSAKVPMLSLEMAKV
jgi:hypothetical protein